MSTPAEIVGTFIAAIERNDLDTAVALLSDDCEYDNQPIRKEFGPEAVRRTLQPFCDQFDEIDWRVSYQAASGTVDDGVVMNERVDRFRKGDHWIELPVAGLFVIKQGRIVLWRDYFDTAQFKAAFGR